MVKWKKNNLEGQLWGFPWWSSASDSTPPSMAGAWAPVKELDPTCHTPKACSHTQTQLHQISKFNAQMGLSSHSHSFHTLHTYIPKRSVRVDFKFCIYQLANLLELQSGVTNSPTIFHLWQYHFLSFIFVKLLEYFIELRRGKREC